MADFNLRNYIFGYAGQDGEGITVNIGSNVTKVPNFMFYTGSSSYSPNIIAVNFAENGQLTSIGGAAFRECSSLTAISIPASVTTIGNSTFYGCSSLTSVTIKGSVTNTGMTIFGGCSNLIEIIVENEDVYLALTNIYVFGYILQYIETTGETVRVLKSVVDSVDPDFTKNTYLNNSSRFTRSVSENGYYVYTRN